MATSQILSERFQRRSENLEKVEALLQSDVMQFKIMIRCIALLR